MAKGKHTGTMAKSTSITWHSCWNAGLTDFRYLLGQFIFFFLFKRPAEMEFTTETEIRAVCEVCHLRLLKEPPDHFHLISIKS